MFGGEGGAKLVAPSVAFSDTSPVNGGGKATAHAQRALAELVEGSKGAVPSVEVLASEADIPWAGHSGRHAALEVYERIKRAKTALVFVNTRSQAELCFKNCGASMKTGCPSRCITAASRSSSGARSRRR